MDEETVKLLLDHLYELYGDAHSVAVSNTERFIYYQRSEKLDVQLKVGDCAGEEVVTFQALVGKKEAEGVGKRNDVSYYAISRPIITNAKVLGAVTAFYNRKPKKMTAPYLTVRKDDRFIPIRYDNVIFMEAQNRKTYVTSLHMTGTYRLNLKELEEVLPNDIFIRCHRSYIVNMHQIKEIHPDSHATFVFIMENDYRVPVSQNYVKKIRRLFNF